jgi:hypothetical protein
MCYSAMVLGLCDLGEFYSSCVRKTVKTSGDRLKRVAWRAL